MSAKIFSFPDGRVLEGGEDTKKSELEAFVENTSKDQMVAFLSNIQSTIQNYQNTLISIREFVLRGGKDMSKIVKAIEENLGLKPELEPDQDS